MPEPTSVVIDGIKYIPAPLRDYFPRKPKFVCEDSRLRALANAYGNFQVCDQSLPKGYVHVQAKRLQPMLKRRNIPFLNAVIGFRERPGYGWSPIRFGVIVATEHAQLLFDLIKRRKKNAAKRRERDATCRARKQALRTQRREEERKALGLGSIDDAIEALL